MKEIDNLKQKLNGLLEGFESAPEIIEIERPEYERLKRLDQNIKKMIEVYKHKIATAATRRSSGFTDDEIELLRLFQEHLESLDK